MINLLLFDNLVSLLFNGQFLKLLLFFVCFQVSDLRAQKNDAFEEVKKRVSKTFFNTPEKAKKDAYQLKKMAKSNYSISLLGYSE